MMESLKPKDQAVATKIADRPNCPLCLFAVTEVYNAIKNNQTEVN